MDYVFSINFEDATLCLIEYTDFATEATFFVEMGIWKQQGNNGFLWRRLKYVCVDNSECTSTTFLFHLFHFSFIILGLLKFHLGAVTPGNIMTNMINSNL